MPIGGHGWITHTDEGSLKHFQRLGCRAVLDVGCGPGGQVIVAADLGYTAIGLEGDPALIGSSPVVLGADFAKNHAQLPMKFDLIWCVEVAEHVEPQFEHNLLRTLQLNCKPHGYLVFTASQNNDPPCHVNCKPMHEWDVALHQHGFDRDDAMYRSMLAESTMKREFLRENGRVYRRQDD